MVTVGAFEAKNTLGTLLDRVEAGEEVLITRHGQPVARLVPDVSAKNRDEARAALQRIRERAKTSGLVDFNWEEIKAMRDEGRR